MKSIILISALIGFFTFNVLSQAQDVKPQSKSNTIILTKNGDALKLLNDLVFHLQDNGYNIEKFNKELFSIETSYKIFKYSGGMSGNHKIFIYARQKDDNVMVVVSGKIEISGIGSQVSYEACNCGVIGDARKNAFTQIINVITSYQWETINFEKR